MSRRLYTLSRSASADLRRISRYTAEQWGEPQQQTYIRQLQDAATALAQGQGPFKDWSTILPGLRMVAVGSHCIFGVHRSDGRPMLILAILHQRMDLMARIQHRLTGL